jgi:hypothetical protein
MDRNLHQMQRIPLIRNAPKQEAERSPGFLPHTLKIKPKIYEKPTKKLFFGHFVTLNRFNVIKKNL